MPHTFHIDPFWTVKPKVEERIENLSVLEFRQLVCPRHASVYILYILDTDKEEPRYFLRELALQ